MVEAITQSAPAAPTNTNSVSATIAGPPETRPKMSEEEIERRFASLQDVVTSLDFPTRRAIQSSLNRLAQSAYLRSTGAHPQRQQLTASVLAQETATAVADEAPTESAEAAAAAGEAAPNKAPPQTPSEDILDIQVARILFNKFLPTGETAAATAAVAVGAVGGTGGVATGAGGAGGGAGGGTA